MRYYPKLKVWRNKPGTNKYDGHIATSYDWHVYAVTLADGRHIVTEGAYSTTTAKHKSQFLTSVACIAAVTYVKAPSGLASEWLDTARVAIQREIDTLVAELANKRIRAIERRQNRISELHSQLTVIDTLARDYRERIVP